MYKSPTLFIFIQLTDRKLNTQVSGHFPVYKAFWLACSGSVELGIDPSQPGLIVHILDVVCPRPAPHPPGNQRFLNPFVKIVWFGADSVRGSQSLGTVLAFVR